ncbi:MAG: response regulator transcription factor [Phycisphaeraceae bacterium]
MKAKRKETAPTGRANLLVVEDEQDLADLLQYNLERSGFNVQCAGSGEEAIKSVRQEQPDLVILDLMLPGIDGLEVCKRLKSDPQTAGIAIVMLTARGEEADIVSGLELGADDYVTKPFSPRVLAARLKAVLRRHSGEAAPHQGDVIKVGDLSVNPERHEVLVAGKPTVTALTRTEFQIVHLLARRPGRVFTRGQIVREAQGDLAAVTDRSVDVHIVSLRRKLGEAGAYIQTVRGVGYRLEPI